MDIVDFYNMTVEREIEDIINLFYNKNIKFHTPIEGTIETEKKFVQYVNRFSLWIQKDDKQINQINYISEKNMEAVEYIIKSDNLELPMALVAQSRNNKIVSLRDYYSMWPIKQGHEIREPFLQPDYDLEKPPVVDNYMQYLSQGDVEAIVDLYSENGYFREPSGSSFLYQGKVELMELYTKILHKGGIELTCCTALVDNGITAIEFIVDKWGETKLPPQQGIAFYEYTEDKLTAARVYDDVEAPL